LLAEVDLDCTEHRVSTTGKCGYDGQTPQPGYEAASFEVRWCLRLAVVLPVHFDANSVTCSTRRSVA
jgi:hypothetical protein